jgi:hypothetical protein
LNYLKTNETLYKLPEIRKTALIIDEAIDLVDNLIPLHEKLESNQFKQFSLEELSAAKEVYGTQVWQKLLSTMYNNEDFSLNNIVKYLGESQMFNDSGRTLYW